jgi:hypothetical protein
MVNYDWPEQWPEHEKGRSQRLKKTVNFKSFYLNVNELVESMLKEK